MTTSSSSSASTHIERTIPPPRGKCCGFLCGEVTVLGIWALIGSAIVTIGVLGMYGKIYMGFTYVTGTTSITFTTLESGIAITAVGGVVLLILLYGIGFVCQSRADRAKPYILGKV